MREYYILLVTVFLGTFYFVFNMEVAPIAERMVSYDSKNHEASKKIEPYKLKLARKRLEKTISSGLPHSPNEKSPGKNSPEYGAKISTANTPSFKLSLFIPEVCMAGFVSTFDWSENPTGGQSKMGVYLHRDPADPNIYIFESNYGKLRCKIEGRRIIWANYNGRWRDHQLDSKILYKVDKNMVRISEHYTDGSMSNSEYTLSYLSKLTKRDKDYTHIHPQTQHQHRAETVKNGVAYQPYESAPRAKEILSNTQEFYRAYKRAQKRKADLLTDNVCDSVYDKFGSADEFFRGLKCKQNYRKQHRIIYD